MAPNVPKVYEVNAVRLALDLAPLPQEGDVASSWVYNKEGQPMGRYRIGIMAADMAPVASRRLVVLLPCGASVRARAVGGHIVQCEWCCEAVTESMAVLASENGSVPNIQ